MTEAQMIEAMARASECPRHNAMFKSCQYDNGKPCGCRAALNAIREHVTIEQETQG